MNIKELMDVALKAGEILLISGAEIYRVEDTIYRICRYYDVECECFVLPTGIFISAVGNNEETISLIKRIRFRVNDLQKIEKVNSFSRGLEVKKLNYTEAMGLLGEIEKLPAYKFIDRLFAAGLTAFVYAILFKGGVLEGAAAMVVGMVVYVSREKVFGFAFFQFFEFFISGLLAGTMSLLASKMFSQLNTYQILVGAIMIFVPGVAITSGIKDALYGDIVSSLSRLAEAIYIAAAVGAGVGIALSIGFRWV